MPKAILLDKIAQEEHEDAVPLPVARITLWTRRWRSTAEDGTVVAVALEKSATNGDILLGGDRSFRIAQMAEEVVAIVMPKERSMAAKIGWYLGNRHLPIEVREEEILLELFPTLTDSLDRIGISYQIRNDVLNCRPHSEHTH
jgi:urease accessory protein UreE